MLQGQHIYEIIIMCKKAEKKLTIIRVFIHCALLKTIAK